MAGTSQVALGDLVSTKVDAAKRMVDSLTSEHKENNEEALDCDQIDDTAVVDLPAERSDLVKVSFYFEILLIRPSVVENFHCLSSCVKIPSDYDKLMELWAWNLINEISALSFSVFRYALMPLHSPWYLLKLELFMCDAFFCVFQVVGIEDLEAGTYSASDIVLPLPGSVAGKIFQYK